MCFFGLTYETMSRKPLLRVIPQAGLAAFDTSLAPEDFSREGIKANRVGEVVARQKQDYPADGNRRQYHAVTRGWVINELFRFINMMAVPGQLS